MSDLFDLDPMHKMREDMERAINPMYDFNKQMEEIRNPLVSSASITRTYESFNEEMKHVLNPMYDFNKEMEDISNPMKKIYDDIGIFSSSKWLDNINKQVEASIESIRSILDTSSFDYIQKYVQQAETEHQKMLDTTMKPYKQIEGLAQKLVSQGLVNKSVMDFINAIQTSSSVVTTVNPEVIQMQVQALEVEVIAGARKQDEIFKLLTEFIESQKNPIIVQFLYLFLFPIILNLLSSLAYDNAIKPLISTRVHEKAVIKTIANDIKAQVPFQGIRTNIRIVTANTLNVRIDMSTKKQIIGKLSFGDIVEVVDKRRNWCLVKKYYSESDTYIQGWVFTRYLGRIK